MADTPPCSSKSQMSSSLRERLKRCGRYHSSPIAPKQRRKDLVPSTFVTPDKSLFIEQRHTDSIDLSSPKLDSDNPMQNSNLIETDQIKLVIGKELTYEPETADSSDVNSRLAAFGDDCVVKRVMVGTPTMSSDRRTHEISRNSTDTPVSSAGKTSRHLGLNRTPVNPNRKTFLPKFQQNLFKTQDSSHKYSDSLPSTPDSVCHTDTSVSSGEVGLNNVPELMVDEKLTETINPIISEVRSRPMTNSGCSQTSGTLTNRHAALKDELAAKTDVLRKLNLVKMYRSKNNLDELQVLIDKWRSASQGTIQDLYSRARDPKPTLQDFIASMQLCPKLLQFNVEEDSFD